MSAEAILALLPPCPIRALSGWMCPGCGMTHALQQLLGFEFRAAFETQPLVFVLLFVSVLRSAEQILARFAPVRAAATRWRVRPGALSEHLAPALLLLSVTHWVWRTVHA